MKSIRHERDYWAALAEFDELCLAEAGTPESARFTEVVDLIDAYTVAREGRTHHPFGWLARWPSLGGATAASR